MHWIINKAKMSTRKLKNQNDGYAVSEEELINMLKPRFNLKDRTVLLCQFIFWVIPSIIMEIYSYSEVGFKNKTYYLTQIGASLVTISSIISTYLIYAKINKIVITNRLRRINHLLFEITFAAQILITIVYWSVLHFQIQDFIKSKGPNFIYYMIWNHTIPMLWIWTEFLLSSQIIFVKDLKYIILFGLIYSFNNFLQTKLVAGKLPYPFMTWKDYNSLVSVGIILMFFWIIYIIAAKISQRFSENSNDKDKEA